MSSQSFNRTKLSFANNEIINIVEYCSEHSTTEQIYRTLVNLTQTIEKYKVEEIRLDEVSDGT